MQEGVPTRHAITGVLLLCNTSSGNVITVGINPEIPVRRVVEIFYQFLFNFFKKCESYAKVYIK